MAACCFLAALIISHVMKVCETFDDSDIDGFNEKSQTGSGGAQKLEGCDAEPRVEEKNQVIKTTFSVDGLECSTCTIAVEGALSQTDGVNKVRVSLSMGEAIVVHDIRIAPRQLLQQIIEGLGYDVSVGGHKTEHLIALLEGKAVLKKARHSLQLAFLLCVSMIALDETMKYLKSRTHGYLIRNTDRVLASIGFAFAIQIMCAASIHQSAWKMARMGRFHMDTLISLSILLGIILSFINIWIYGVAAETYFRSVSSTAMAVLAGRYLQKVSRKESQSSLTKLFKLSQPTAICITAQGEVDVPTTILNAADKVVVNPYTLIPCDGYVSKGTSVINESLRTGETMPVAKSVGDDVWGGTRNGPGKLEVTVRATYEESSLSKLIESIHTTNNGRTEQFAAVDQWNERFVPLVLISATLGFVGQLALAWHRYPNIQALNFAARRAMAILMSACPCALGLAAPSAVMAAVDVASRHGILVRGGLTTLQSLTKVSHVIMDKTGTLTSGSLEVQEMLLNEEWQKNRTIICLLVGRTEEPFAISHPISKAIFRASLKESADHWPQFISSTSVSILSSPFAGNGVASDIEYQGVMRRVCLGNAEFMKENGVKLENSLDPVVPENLSVYVSVEHKHAATILLKDTIRKGAESTIRHLQNNARLDVQILTGDTQPQADRVATALGLNVLAASATPKEKHLLVEKTRKAGGVVAMVGDGINDALALAAADIGIMIGNGKSCSTTGGQILLLGDDLASMKHAWTIAEAAMDQIRVNTKWAVGYNAVAMLLSAGILEIPLIGLEVTPTAAAAMMGLSSVLVSWFSLGLRNRLNNLLDGTGTKG